MSKAEKLHQAEISKLNAKLNKQESLVVKYFGVENEMVSLRQSILEKDNEIASLRAASAATISIKTDSGQGAGLAPNDIDNINGGGISPLKL